MIGKRRLRRAMFFRPWPDITRGEIIKTCSLALIPAIGATYACDRFHSFSLGVALTLLWGPLPLENENILTENVEFGTIKQDWNLRDNWVLYHLLPN